jgi:lipopolysaccharide transport system ATP-binding protein
MTDTIINAHNIVKQYKYSAMGIKNLLLRKSKIQMGRLNRQRAISNISFTLQRGEGMAIIGHNGSGKTTLLSIVLGTIIPDQGDIKISGKVTPLMQLGAGFDPDLTGRENLRVYATLLGLKKSEIAEIEQKIIDFSELGKSIDEILRTYSDGMIARLGFAVVIHIPTDILIIDEVLGVGDVDFRKKCHDALLQKKSEGLSFVIVSHNVNELTDYCEKCLILKEGKAIYEGRFNPNILEEIS